MENEESKLYDFLLDIECLNPLTEYANKFNMFDILKITTTEIRHSNVLSWFLDPKGNHGLGDRILRAVIQHIAVTQNEPDTEKIDFQSFRIQREWKNIDILAESNEFVLCIENKIFSGEHDNQLARYKEIIENKYPNHKKMYVYLTPYGIKSSDPENWYSMSYADILNIIENSKKETTLCSEAELFLKNYIYTIRRYVLGDEELKKMCADIYTKHKTALDLIYKYKPDRISDITQIFHKWANEKTEKQEIIFNPNDCTKNIIRFKTDSLRHILPDLTEDNSSYGWGKNNYHFYELKVDNDGYSIYLMLTLYPENMPESEENKLNTIMEHFPTQENHKNDKNGKYGKWLVPFKTKIINLDEKISEDNIIAQLNEFFEELKNFEISLKEELNKPL